ncbi:MAG: DUF4124 domain-containing protein [Pseudomonadales bacterium]|nr:DUF4124 domain-containing protein [Pseudomonadales bacterium]
MRYSINIILILLALASPSSLLASGVFKCTDDQGTTTFSFTPCAAPEPQEAEEIAEKKPQVSKKDELLRLDSEISDLQNELETVKREYEDALAVSNGRQSSDELTHQFDTDTMRLLSELNDLQAERKRVARL